MSNPQSLIPNPQPVLSNFCIMEHRDSGFGVWLNLEIPNPESPEGTTMKAKYANFIWGLALILAGVVFLAQSLGYISELDPLTWIGFFTVLSLLFFVSYFLSGLREWGWLFPASIFAGLAVTLSLGVAGADGSYVAAPLLFSVAVPFLAAYFIDRQHNTWALIPAWVLIAITLVVLLADSVPGEVIGALVLYAVAAPFLVVYLTNRTRRWALIPAFVLAVVGIIPLIAGRVEGSIIGAFMMFMIAAPFAVVYAASPKNWWAVIPAGIMASIGLTALLTGGGDADERGPLLGALLFAGWALTFLFLWWRRAVHDTGWAKWPAMGLAIVGAIILLAGGESARIAMPVLIIAAGVVVLYYALRGSGTVNR